MLYQDIQNQNLDYIPQTKILFPTQNTRVNHLTQLSHRVSIHGQKDSFSHILESFCSSFVTYVIMFTCNPLTFVVEFGFYFFMFFLQMSCYFFFLFCCFFGSGFTYSVKCGYIWRETEVTIDYAYTLAPDLCQEKLKLWSYFLKIQALSQEPLNQY